jgi:hypothetical protein
MAILLAKETTKDKRDPFQKGTKPIEKKRIASAMAIPVAIEKVQPGTPARADFEANFKAGITKGLKAVSASDIVIDTIKATSSTSQHNGRQLQSR